MVLVNGVWGTVCDDGFGNYEADTACRAMGYSRAIYNNDVGSNNAYNCGYRKTC